MPPKMRPMPPWRSRSMSSMLSAPTTIPATRALTFTAGLHPPGAPSLTCPATRSDNPARSARAITGTKPTADTRLSSSKRLEIVCTAWECRTRQMLFLNQHDGVLDSTIIAGQGAFARHDTHRDTHSHGGSRFRRLPQARLGRASGRRTRCGRAAGGGPGDRRDGPQDHPHPTDDPGCGRGRARQPRGEPGGPGRARGHPAQGGVVALRPHALAASPAGALRAAGHPSQGGDETSLRAPVWWCQDSVDALQRSEPGAAVKWTAPALFSSRTTNATPRRSRPAWVPSWDQVGP